MLCFLGLLMLASLALFSARYRPLAREAFDCFFRRVTLRKCTTGLDRRQQDQPYGLAPRPWVETLAVFGYAMICCLLVNDLLKAALTKRVGLQT